MISDESIEAAMLALGERYGDDAYCKEREYVVTVLEAASPHMLAAKVAEAKSEGWDASTKLHFDLFGRSLVGNPYRSQP